MDLSKILIANVRLADLNPASPDDLWNIECSGGRVVAVERVEATRDVFGGASTIDAKGGLLLPSLAHAHIHLDKCFILDRCQLETGDFAEALKVTNQAKAAFDPQDLYQRGYKLIRDSLEWGVTSMRAHVEIDTGVEISCLEVGMKLKKVFDGICDIQLAVFAQEPLFDAVGTLEPGRNYTLLAQGAESPGIQVVGSAPYVEPTTEQAKVNIALILQLAQSRGCHVDFHLDYNLDPESEPLIYEVISLAKQISWPSTLRITIGHATRLQLFTPAEWTGLASAIGNLPITFVGLPQSDMYMLGRNETDSALGPPRSTLRVPYIANKYGFEVAMSVNNVQNAFTPQGSVDPLSLCTLGVTLFQSATPKDVRTLVRAVTLASKRAIGQERIHADLCISINDPADFVILHGTPNLQAAVLCPSYDRTTIRAGLVVARRCTSRWFAGDI
ncbi:hypothetical protein C8R43DRAFT_904623 [Mycena crocata]|nr:hypothetical protein C8R43DRAFT_904623 [Mycena crocata]